MKPTGCLTQIILLLVGAAILAVPLACLATLTAPLHSPAFGSQVLCPPGAQLESEWYRATTNQPGQRTLSVTCVDGQGSPVEANPRDERTLAAGIGLYFPVCFGPTAALGLVGLLLANSLLRARRRRAQPRPAA